MKSQSQFAYLNYTLKVCSLFVKKKVNTLECVAKSRQALGHTDLHNSLAALQTCNTLNISNVTSIKIQIQSFPNAKRCVLNKLGVCTNIPIHVKSVEYTFSVTREIFQPHDWIMGELLFHNTLIQTKKLSSSVKSCLVRVGCTKIKHLRNGVLDQMLEEVCTALPGTCREALEIPLHGWSRANPPYSICTLRKLCRAHKIPKAPPHVKVRQSMFTTLMR